MKTFTLIIVLFVLNSYRLGAEIVTMMTAGHSGPTSVIFQASSAAYTNTYSVVSNSEPVSFITGSISIRAGETVKILYCDASNLNLQFNIGGRAVWMGNGSLGSGTPFFVGPGTLSLTLSCIGGSGCWQGIVTAQIMRNDEPFVPNGAVLVPADASGPVSVLLESSTNLVAWSSALPGTYGTTSQNQYFRVRAVRQTP